MRKLIILISALLAAGWCAAEHTGALLRLEKEGVDFGAIEYESEVTDSLRIYNDGHEPLVITSVFSECGCTVPSYSHDPIEPGDSGMIAVRFISKGREPGYFRKAVRIKTNGEPPRKVFFVEGRIKRPYRK